MAIEWLTVKQTSEIEAGYTQSKFLLVDGFRDDSLWWLMVMGDGSIDGFWWGECDGSEAFSQNRQPWQLSNFEGRRKEFQENVWHLTAEFLNAVRPYATYPDTP